MSFRNRTPRDGDDSPGEEDPAATARRAYATCIKLLGARDHSTVELTRKLGDRKFEPELIATVLHELSDSNYLNDARYAITYVEQRIARGYGPRAIENKLRERGIEGALQQAAFKAAAPDWAALAEEALVRKFRADQILDRDQKAKARLARFLQGRGFGTGDSLRAIENAQRAEAGRSEG